MLEEPLWNICGTRLWLIAMNVAGTAWWRNVAQYMKNELEELKGTFLRSALLSAGRT